MPILSVLQVAITNLLLSSDNVLLIALMSDRVRRDGRWTALTWSLVISLALQLGILLVMGYLFRFQLVRLVFGVVICVVAFHLVQSRRTQAVGATEDGMPAAVARITVGNLLMSFENEAALITLAAGNAWLAWAGVVLTSPIVFFGSHPVAWLLRRCAVIVYAAAVYLFSVGIGMLGALPLIGRGYGAPEVWVLTGVFGAYAAVAFVRHLRAERQPDPVA